MKKRLDLISRTALIAEYDRVHIGAPGGARKLMVDAPTVDAVEVVHGRWKRVDDDLFRCSACDEWIVMKNDWFYYCPNCGAKMDGDSK